MSFIYNIDFELAAAAYMIILYIFLLIQYSAQSEINREFRKLTLYVLTANIMDVATAITISYAADIPVWANVLVNTLYFAAAALLASQFMRYVNSYVSSEGEENKRFFRFNNFLIYIYLLFLFANMFFGYIFSFHGDGAYIHGKLYLIVYILPLYYILYSGGILLHNRSVFHFKQMVSIGIFIILALAGPVLQMVCFPDILLANFTVTLAILVILFSLETPDYYELIKTMVELKRTKEEAELARKEALEANHAKTEFLANMSHEVRTPINAILGYNEMIMRETRESHTTAYAVNVQAAGRTLLSIINNILDFTNIDTGRLKLENGPYYLSSLFQDIITYAEYYAEKKNLELRLSIDENLPCRLSGDVVRLMQIFNNLISNAAKYTNEGFIEIIAGWKAESEDTGVMSVQIRDTGIGMKKEDIQKISESFSRFDNRKTRNIQGIGLGLSIVTRLLDLMDSRLIIESQYEKGSTFSFQIRQKIVEAAPIGKIGEQKEYDFLQQSKLEEKFTAPSAKILAVDDNIMNLDLLKGILKNTKLQIDTATNGAEALKMLEQEKYHLIFLDHMMPVMDGMETLKEIKRRGICNGVPVIALTANAIAGVKEVYLEAGFDDYLSKPIVGRLLEETVKRYLPPELVLEEENNGEQEILTEKRGELSFLERLSFLDTETGMSYCCEDEDFYREMLSAYLSTEKRQDIIDFYEKEDWDNYRILVHALKSASLSIGAKGLSEKARQLEMAAKEEDMDFIREHHGETMQNYETLLSSLSGVLNGEEEEDGIVAASEEREAYILVIDDDSMNLRIAEKMLGDRFRLTCLKSGREALDFLEKEVPNLILLDLHMPEMNGFEVIRKLKEDRRLKEIPVIFLTADNDREVEVKGFKEGALDFITKPFIADIMIQRVTRILELDRLQKNLQQEVEKQTKKAEERRMKVERLSRQIMQALASAIDAKDEYTNGHSLRVADYSKAIAARLGKSPKEQEDIYYTGLLHDIGKIGIPDEIINKTTKLTDEEYNKIKAHPAIGANILKNISEISGIETGARWHHERYDGNGYPDRLKGEDIPEVARIIGVADTYDAMTSRRSYRDVLAQKIVREEIEKGKGTQFDPLFADKMLELIDEDTEYRMRQF
ncbi:MAG: response regulator [Lachnospiraceae bacterium]|nr:response regulator [Lachnospiraceae bacterium]